MKRTDYVPQTIPDKAHPLVKQLFRFMMEQEITIEELSRQVGCYPQTIAKWAHTSGLYYPQLGILEACFNVLGYELTVVPTSVEKYGRMFERIMKSRRST